MHEGVLIPSVVVLSHTEQLDRLKTYCPDAVGATLVAGDPCFDRIVASRPLRETYRHSLGARPEQRVVMVSSTWGGSSLLGRNLSLVMALARELPVDEYRIVVALHPNIWHRHSPWQVRMWLADCARAGVTVLPPDEGWRAAIVAADITIGDHGSVTFYSAALGTPLLLAAWPEDAVDPHSPIAALLAVAPRIEVERDLVEQIESTIRTHSAARYSAITGLTTSAPGESARLLRAAVYARLGMREPHTVAEPIALPVPDVSSTPLHSQLVDVRLRQDEPQCLDATVTRYPAEALRDSARLPSESILVTSTAEPYRRWLEMAEILIHDRHCADPAHWVHTSLAALPGCVLAAVRHGRNWLVGGTDMPLVQFTGADDLGPAYAATLHAWLRAGRSVDELPELARIRLGGRIATAHINLSA